MQDTAGQVAPLLMTTTRAREGGKAPASTVKGWSYTAEYFPAGQHTIAPGGEKITGQLADVYARHTLTFALDLDLHDEGKRAEHEGSELQAYLAGRGLYVKRGTEGSVRHLVAMTEEQAAEWWPAAGKIPGGEIRSAGLAPSPGATHPSGETYEYGPGPDLVMYPDGTKIRTNVIRFDDGLKAALIAGGAHAVDDRDVTAGDADLPDDDGRCPRVSVYLAEHDFTGATPRGSRANAAVNHLKLLDAEGHHIGGRIDEVIAALPDTGYEDFTAMWATAPVPAGTIAQEHPCCSEEFAWIRNAARPAMTAPSVNGHGTAAPGLPPAACTPMNLPGDFWDALPVLGHVRRAAWSRGRPADTVLHSVLGRVAAMWPYKLRLDTGTASPASANYYAVLGGGAGASKTSSAAVARDLLPGLAAYPGLMSVPGIEARLFADDVPLGSGEGLAEAYMGAVEIPPGNGKGKPKVIRQKVRDHAFVFLDEGGALVKSLERGGATIGAELRRAWMGETIGQANASPDRTRIVSRGTYSLGMVIGFQPSTIGPLIADFPAGTPQRFCYALACDPAVPDSRPDWPGELGLDWAAVITPNTAETWQTEPMPFAAPVRAEIAGRDLARVRGAAQAIPLAEHEDLTRAKLAGLLAALCGVAVVTEELWQLTAVLWATSCAVRDWLGGYGAYEAAQAEQRERGKLIGRQRALDDAADERAMAQAVRSAARHVHRGACKDGCKRRCITQAIRGSIRVLVSVDDVIDRMTGAGYVKAEGDVFLPGDISPP
jgi:hypothetical protein